MKPSRALVWLSSLVVVLALVTAGTGLFWMTAGSPFPFTTLRGDAVEIYGQGLYYYDTIFSAEGFRGTDAVTLFIAIPLLVLAILLYRRGTLVGRFMLLSTLAYFLYNAASMALGAAYNNLILLYIAYLSASLFAFILAFKSIDLESLPGHISPALPRRAIATFLFVAGTVLLVWVIDIVSVMAQGIAPPLLASYTTKVTHVLDLAVLMPSAFLGGLLLLRRNPLGYPIAAIMLFMNAIIAVVIVAQTIAQQAVGVTIGMGEFMMFGGSFITMSLFAITLLVILLRHIDAPAPRRVAHV
jgi:hypothetical protein